MGAGGSASKGAVSLWRPRMVFCAARRGTLVAHFQVPCGSPESLALGFCCHLVHRCAQLVQDWAQTCQCLSVASEGSRASVSRRSGRRPNLGSVPGAPGGPAAPANLGRQTQQSNR